MCLEGDLAWSRAGCADGLWSDRDWAPSVVSGESPIVGTRSSRREVAASSLVSMVSASLAGSVEGIVAGEGGGERGGGSRLEHMEMVGGQIEPE